MHSHITVRLGRYPAVVGRRTGIRADSTTINAWDVVPGACSLLHTTGTPGAAVGKCNFCRRDGSRFRCKVAHCDGALEPLRHFNLYRGHERLAPARRNPESLRAPEFSWDFCLEPIRLTHLAAQQHTKTFLMDSRRKLKRLMCTRLKPHENPTATRAG